ncbi:MAG: DUF1549 domain-containing protein [Planctomycetes bacterium]|nr:DUF1549 domain-containing protein [Planctomycetota bacterium]
MDSSTAKRSGSGWLASIRIAICICSLFGSPLSAAEDTPVPVRFGTEVVPILTRLGCNSGGCHGKASGQNGFKLSLLGFEPELDYEFLVSEGRGRRVIPGSPDRSLLLLKATSRVPHGGGRRLAESSDDYRTLSRWIAAGALPPRPDDPRLERIELTPHEKLLQPGSPVALHVTAHFSDGTNRDVTSQCVYQSNEPEIITVDTEGVAAAGARSGLAVVMARFGEQLATFHGAVPATTSAERLANIHQQLDALEQDLRDSPFDTLLLRQWRRLAIVPSPTVDDATFLRRVMIDICGTLPTPDEVRDYLADSRPDKRDRLVDRLLDRPEYASYFALKWGDILQNRGAGYSTSRQRPGTTLFAGWIRDSIAANKPYDQFVSEILTASGSQKDNPAALWYRTVRKPIDYVESTAQAFLGVRIQCAQCHHHPAERWSQADYYGLAAAFARVGRKGGFADAEVPTEEIIFLKEQGGISHPRTGELLAPRPLGGDPFRLDARDDPRVELARWLTAADNPYFARTLVNRYWAHFLGRGIIHPIDDARDTNPPSSPELLDALARDFVASGYDLKHLIRVICGTHAYRLAAGPTEWNAGDDQSYSHFSMRRLTAEVLLDGISQVLDVPTPFNSGTGDFPPGTRALDLPDENVAARFLDIFGRPARMSACECERADAPSLAQALELVNSSEIQRKLTAETGFAKRLATQPLSPTQRATAVITRVFTRHPTPSELQKAAAFLESEPDQAEACRSLLWALLATNEFLFNH